MHTFTHHAAGALSARLQRADRLPGGVRLQAGGERLQRPIVQHRAVVKDVVVEDVARVTARDSTTYIIISHVTARDKHKIMLYQCYIYSTASSLYQN